jgi:predicted Zn-dependent peptidase
MQMKLKSLLLVFFSVLMVLPAFAQKSWDEIEYPELNSFEKPDVEFFELDNGISFYLVEDDELPLINLRTLVRTGGVLVPNEKAGLQSVTGTVMRSGGTTSITGDELNELLEDRAARMETGIGLTSGSASMNVLKEDFEELLPVYIDLLQNPAFPEDRIDLAKTQQKTAISRRNDETLPIGIREFQKLIYGPESVYARNTEYETIDNITREDLVDFHRKSFVGENMMVGVIGDFEMEEMKEVLREAFQDIPAGSELELTFPDINYEFVNTINFVDKSDVNQSFVMMGHIGGLRENPDYAKIQVLNRVLSDGFSGRLMQVVRSQMGLAYSVFGEYGSGNFFPGMFYAGVMTQSETTAEAINAIIGQIERLQNEPITEKELSDTKDRFLNSLVFEYDSRASVLNEQMSFDYAGLPDDTFDRLVEEIQQVTIEDVQQAAQQYMQPENLQILVVGNGEEIGDQLDQFGEVNEIDITIPQPGDDEEVVAGDRASGTEWMERMAVAVLPAGGIDGNFTFEAANEVNTPQGTMTLNVTQTADFENEILISEVQTPMANVTMRIEDGEGTMVMGGNEMPMPPAQRDQVLAEFYRSHIYLAINRESLDVEYMGMAEMDGETYAHVRVNDEMTLNLYLDPETGLPMVTTYRQFNPQVGGNSTIKLVSTNWTEVDGVVVPYETTVYTDDEVSAVTTISSHSVE